MNIRYLYNQIGKLNNVDFLMLFILLYSRFNEIIDDFQEVFMVDIFWNIMSRLTELIVPLVAIYITFDFIGSILFNKRQEVFLCCIFYQVLVLH